MVLSQYIFKYPYSLVWQIASRLKLNNYNAAYCGDVLDYYIMEPVLHYLPELRLIAGNRKVQKELALLKIKSQILPAFPYAVLMCRLAAHKFPAKNIIKIGMRHGPYHFKAFSHKDNYQLFDLFFFTSEKEAEIARDAGIDCGIGIGYPKLDKAFNGEIDAIHLDDLKKNLKISHNKITLLFTATWEASKMSALERWYKRIGELSAAYNVLVSLHPWVAEKYRQKLRNTKGVHLIETFDTTPYIMLADICIGDTSSILGECCALDKPIITFFIEKAPRLAPGTMQIIDSFSLRINTFDQLIPAIDMYSQNPDLKKSERQKANEIMYSNLDGTSGIKAANLIRHAFNLSEFKEEK